MLHGILQVDVIGQNQNFLLNRKAVEVAGLPNGNLFFGYPDLEYSLRIRQAGFQLLVDGNLMREERTRWGKLDYSRTQSLLPRRPLNGTWRNYYTTRTYIYMMQHTFGRPDLARREALKAIGRSVFSWRRGIQYGLTFTHLQLRGVIDGYCGKLGCTVSPQTKSVKYL
jgi:hypothetical protein